MSAGFALVASTTSRLGIPIRFAESPASAFPTFPDVTMNPGSAPCSFRYWSDAVA